MSITPPPPDPHQYFKSYYVTKNPDGTFSVGSPTIYGDVAVYDKAIDGDTSSEDLTQLGDIESDHYATARTDDNGHGEGLFIGSTAHGFIGKRFLPGITTGYYLYTTRSYGAHDKVTTEPTAYTIACYVGGTRILTVDGEVAVETLKIGDLVVTAFGRERPIKWIGRRAYTGRFVNASPGALPVCFKAGSLAEGVPVRDLWVSPKHAMFLDGVLVPAEQLVNGTSIVRAQRVEQVAYWHIELESHDVLLAEGAPSESYVDDDNRGMFANAHEFCDLFPDAGPQDATFCAPRIEDGHALTAIRRRLALRARALDVGGTPAAA